MANEETRQWQQTATQMGYDLFGIDPLSQEEMNDLCEALSITSVRMKTRLRTYIKLLQAEPRDCFVVNASIQNARQVKGVRAAVYKKAEESRAFYSPSGERPIRYGNEAEFNTLVVTLLFKDENSALTFATSLRLWDFSHPGASVNPVVDDAPARCQRPTDMWPVKFNDYDPNEADDSPCTSLADFKGTTLSLETEPVEMDSELKKYQKIESDAWCGKVGAYKLHLKDKAIKKFEDLKHSENNMLAGSWIFHQYFDGLNLPDYPHRTPLVAVKPLKVHKPAEVLQDGARRFRVDVQIEFFTKAAAITLSGMLKDGTGGGTDALIRTSWVHVLNHDVFVDCLQWKYDHNKQKWLDHQAMLDRM